MKIMLAPKSTKKFSAFSHLHAQIQPFHIYTLGIIRSLLVVVSEATAQRHLAGDRRLPWNLRAAPTIGVGRNARASGVQTGDLAVLLNGTGAAFRSGPRNRLPPKQKMNEVDWRNYFWYILPIISYHSCMVFESKIIWLMVSISPKHSSWV